MEKVSEYHKERENEEGKDEENSSSINHEEGENEPSEETNDKEDSSSSLSSELHGKRFGNMFIIVLYTQKEIFIENKLMMLKLCCTQSQLFSSCVSNNIQTGPVP